VLRAIGIEESAEHVNPNGGATALGHPLGTSGARIIGNAAVKLGKRKGRLGLFTRCVGVGRVSMSPSRRSEFTGRPAVGQFNRPLR
jgi:acetyl-CoA acyltransferase